MRKYTLVPRARVPPVRADLPRDVLAAKFCPVVSPEGRHLYLTSDRNQRSQLRRRAVGRSALRPRMERRPRHPGDGLDDSSRVPTSAVVEAPERTPR